MKIIAGMIFIWRPVSTKACHEGAGHQSGVGVSVCLRYIRPWGLQLQPLMGQVHGGGRGREGEETQRNETGRIKGGRGDRVGEKDGRMMKGDWRAKRKSE